MESKEIKAQYEVPQVKIIELSLDQNPICALSNTEKLEETPGEW